MAKVTNLSLGTGRRKTSVARVYLRSGNGAIMVNGKSVEAYFANPEHVFTVKQEDRQVPADMVSPELLQLTMSQISAFSMPTDSLQETPEW